MDIDRAEKIINILSDLEGKLADISAIAGFDGFIDIITRPIAFGDSKSPKKYYSKIKEFSTFISERAGCCSSIELDELCSKIGGNAPIYANAMGSLGVSTTCIGAFGYPEIINTFKSMSDNCTLVSVATPGICTAIEFNDGKLMLALNGEMNSMSWSSICQRAGLDRIISTFQESKLIGLFNWSETPMADDIWRGILCDIAPKLDKNKQFLFDFSDCARRKKKEILSMLKLVQAFGNEFPVTISMNENEASAVFEALEIPNENLAQSGRMLLDRISAQNIVFHFHQYTLGVTEKDAFRYDTYRIACPAITTGAGDNFNAGLSLGLLLGLPLMDSIAIASSTSSYYVAYGHSPNPVQLKDFIQSSIKSNQKNERMI